MLRQNGNQNVAFQVQTGNGFASVLAAVCTHRGIAAKHREPAKRPDDSRLTERRWRCCTRRISTCSTERPSYASGRLSRAASMRSMSRSIGRELPPAAWAALVLSRA